MENIRLCKYKESIKKSNSGNCQVHNVGDMVQPTMSLGATGTLLPWEQTLIFMLKVRYSKVTEQKGRNL